MSETIENYEMIVNEDFLAKAEALKPELIKVPVKPDRLVDIVESAEDYIAKNAGNVSDLKDSPMGEGDDVCLDFGDHHVGYVSFKLTPVGSPPDAPAYLRLKFGEIPYEIAANSANYHGSISRSWIQEEFLHIDILPAVIKLPRRYAFRYMQLSVIDTSPKYKVVLSDVVCETVSSVSLSDAMPLKTKDSDLVKRCLYLFAGLPQAEGRIGACLYLEPKLQVDDVALFDYSLFFVSCLHDYYEATGDMETLKELFPVADRQIELALRELDQDGVVKDKDTWWCFLDWADGLNKQAGAQAVLIYTLKQAQRMAHWLKDEAKAKEYASHIETTTKGALDILWDKKQGFFVSGAEKQVSWTSQIWFVLAGVFDKEKNKELLHHLIDVNPKIGMVTPYMYHHFIDALMQSGCEEEAFANMQAYWGEMIRDGVDTFFELYNPDNKYISAYGDCMINSFCHAWSGTPAYFIRKYLDK